MTATVVIGVLGIGVLTWLGVLIGTQLDTKSQRRAHRRLAEQRRMVGEDRRAGFMVRRCDPETLCSNCPFR